MSLLLSLQTLIHSFDNEDNLPNEASYDLACSLISSLFGDDAVKMFSVQVDATDGGFYYRRDMNGDLMWKKLMYDITKETYTLEYADGNGEIVFKSGLKDDGLEIIGLGQVANDEKCTACGEPYEKQDVDGGRCTKCGSMIV